MHKNLGFQPQGKLQSSWLLEHLAGLSWAGGISKLLIVLYTSHHSPTSGTIEIPFAKEGTQTKRQGRAVKAVLLSQPEIGSTLAHYRHSEYQLRVRS